MAFDPTEEARRAFIDWQVSTRRVRGAEEELAREAFTAGFIANAQQLKDAEEALLEAQNERDAVQERLDKHEPPYRPKKFA